MIQSVVDDKSILRPERPTRTFPQLTVNLALVATAMKEDADLLPVVHIVVVDAHVVATLRCDDTCKQHGPNTSFTHDALRTKLCIEPGATSARTKAKSDG